MASIYEKPPIFYKEQKWEEKDLSSLDKAKFQGQHQKAEVYIYGGDLGMEFFLSKTRPAFIQAATKLNWTWSETFSEFENVLDGAPRTAWHETLFGMPNLDRNLEESFNAATDEMIRKLENNRTPRDQQWIYLAPGGDYNCYKDLMMSPVDLVRRIREVVRISLQLPAGNIPDPSEPLLLQWIYMMFHSLDRAHFVNSGRRLELETIDTITMYFQAIHDQKIADGSLRRQEQQRAAKRAERERGQTTRRTGSNNDTRSNYRTNSREYRSRDNAQHFTYRGRDDQRTYQSDGRADIVCTLRTN